MRDPVAVLALLIASVAAAEWLGQTGLGRRLGPAVIVIGAILGNSGIVPSASTSTAVYDAIFTIVAPISIFLLLLDVEIGALRRAGGPMLLAFGLGALGTMAGAFAAVHLTGVQSLLGEKAGPLSGMFTGTYIGGSTNFNAIALHYEVVNDSIVFVGATAVDAILGTIFIIVILAMPAAIYRLGLAKPRERGAAESQPGAVSVIPKPKAISVASRRYFCSHSEASTPPTASRRRAARPASRSLPS